MGLSLSRVAVFLWTILNSLLLYRRKERSVKPTKELVPSSSAKARHGKTHSMLLARAELVIVNTGPITLFEAIVTTASTPKTPKILISSPLPGRHPFEASPTRKLSIGAIASDESSQSPIRAPIPSSPSALSKHPHTSISSISSSSHQSKSSEDESQLSTASTSHEAERSPTQTPSDPPLPPKAILNPSTKVRFSPRVYPSNPYSAQTTLLGDSCPLNLSPFSNDARSFVCPSPIFPEDSCSNRGDDVIKRTSFLPYPDVFDIDGYSRNSTLKHPSFLPYPDVFDVDRYSRDSVLGRDSVMSASSLYPAFVSKGKLDQDLPIAENVETSETSSPDFTKRFTFGVPQVRYGHSTWSPSSPTSPLLPSGPKKALAPATGNNQPRNQPTCTESPSTSLFKGYVFPSPSKTKTTNSRTHVERYADKDEDTESDDVDPMCLTPTPPSHTPNHGYGHSRHRHQRQGQPISVGIRVSRLGLGLGLGLGFDYDRAGFGTPVSISRSSSSRFEKKARMGKAWSATPSWYTPSPTPRPQAAVTHSPTAVKFMGLGRTGTTMDKDIGSNVRQGLDTGLGLWSPELGTGLGLGDLAITTDTNTPTKTVTKMQTQATMTQAGGSSLVPVGSDVAVCLMGACQESEAESEKVKFVCTDEQFLEVLDKV
ncbi:hypothetical protein D9758_003850 [Tetrapyrgos nigripes]|uniref:Uncharacterized protein n=1 Tax=Tetrapyrgos nigripes TaxID=182062 RepID=A0A8H5GLU9_9AGAR|nr:hypothetical protein D9758_003850 [Tetrapyrgos nigripes]